MHQKCARKRFLAFTVLKTHFHLEFPLLWQFTFWLFETGRHYSAVKGRCKWVSWRIPHNV